MTNADTEREGLTTLSFYFRHFLTSRKKILLWKQKGGFMIKKEENIGGTKSFWMEEPFISFSKLETDKSAEVVIIGAGIAGLTTAYLLSREGKKAILLEKGPIGCGQTSRTTAHLTNAFDDRYYEMERLHGKEGAFYIAESHTAAIGIIERIVKEENIDCDFEKLPGYLFSESKEDDEAIKKEYDAAKKAGVPGVEMSATQPWQKDSYRSLLFPDQAQLHALKYLNGLARAAEKNGVEIHSDARVIEVVEGDPNRLKIDTGNVLRAKHVLLATNSPINRNVAIHGRQSPYRSYVIGIRIKPGSFPHVLAWDMKDPYHYVRLSKKGGDTLIVGGEDHRTGVKNDMDSRYENLERWARERFPELGAVVYKWSGQVMEPSDGVAFIGVNPGSEHVYVISGDSGNGMTHGTLGAKIITDLIAGQKNSWSRIYDPSRYELKATPEYVKDGAETNAQYKEWFTGDERKAEDIKKEEGAVFRKGTKKICVYRDRNGKLHKRSAVCPHLGCIVAWNSGEKSWDCPCHGSIFSATGKVIEGPAVADLAEEE